MPKGQAVTRAWRECVFRQFQCSATMVACFDGGNAEERIRRTVTATSCKAFERPATCASMTSQRSRDEAALGSAGVRPPRIACWGEPATCAKAGRQAEELGAHRCGVGGQGWAENGVASPGTTCAMTRFTAADWYRTQMVEASGRRDATAPAGGKMTRMPVATANAAAPADKQHEPLAPVSTRKGTSRAMRWVASRVSYGVRPSACAAPGRCSECPESRTASGTGVCTRAP